MLPLFTYPLALIGIVSLPVLAAIYLMRNRFRRKTVSSLFLWQLQERSKEGGVKVQNIQVPLIFFLELLILALLVIAATGPRWQLGSNIRPLVIVLDDSASMTATTSKGDVRANAMKALNEIVGRQRFLNYRIILAGQKARLLGSPMRTADELQETLKEWHCHSAASDLSTAVAFAREISRDDAYVVLITDRAPPEQLADAPRLRWWSFGEANGNIGFVNVARSLAEETDRCLFEIRNFTDDVRSTPLEVRAGGKLIQRKEIDLGTNATKRIVLNLPKDTPAVVATLGDDALPADNSAQLLSPLRKRVRVAVGIENEALAGLINRSLAATGLRASLSAAPHLILHDKPGVVAGSNTWAFEIHSHEDAKSLSDPFVIDTSHPLGRGLALNGTAWAAAPITNKSGFLPIITSGPQSLLAVNRDIIGRHRIFMNLNPELSTVSRTPNLPILFYNLLEWRRAEMPGLEDVNFRPGTSVRIRTEGDSLKLTHPGGQVEELGVGDGRIIARADVPGLYQVDAADGNWGFAINFLAADESDLRTTTTAKWGTWETKAEARRYYSSVLWLFVLLGLSGIVAHQYFVTQGRSRV
ncbi:MAG: vWA domain-containing protein [Limisphaerales bacterium]